MSSKIRGLGALLLCALVSMGADGCPLAPEAPAETPTPTPTVSGALDVGGPAGARWEVRFDGTLAVTLRSGKQVEGATTAARQGPVVLLGQTVDVAGFCLRPDVVCPHQVLPARAAIAQPGDDPAQVLLEYNRRGPLSRVRVAGIPGLLDGTELSFSLATNEVPGDPCHLRQPSAVLATAVLPAGGLAAAESAAQGGEGEAAELLVAGEQATQLTGRVTVAYGGTCLAIGGSGAVDPEAVVELAVGFSATREGATSAR